MLAAKLILTAGILIACGAATAAGLMPGFHRSLFWNEQVRGGKTAEGIRYIVNAADTVDPEAPTIVIFYATPNGNTIEQTLGCQMTPGLDWHYDIQHIAAQVRMLRDFAPQINMVLVCAEVEVPGIGRSWPSWRGKHKDNAKLIKAFIEDQIKDLPARTHHGSKDIRIVLSGHSGGGSMIFGFLNSADSIPANVKQIAWLDANYAYSDAEKHGDKLIDWLDEDRHRTLVVICYDDRNITLDGKPVVGPTGGTYRATERMRTRFEKDMKLEHTVSGDIDRYVGLEGQVTFIVHRNPQNKILHTALVGDMNGFLEATTLNTSIHDQWGKFGSPRGYTKWIQAAPQLPPALEQKSQMNPAIAASRRDTGGAKITERLTDLSREDREAALTTELKAGNVPPFLLEFVTIEVSGTDAEGRFHRASYQVTPDYLAVGTDKDFVRLCITPMAAQPIADYMGCSLPTRKMVDQIHKQAKVKLEPKPLTEDRDALKTFIQHNGIIETQRSGQDLGALVAGTKKDVVITNLLQEKKNRVAIYGWHKLDGEPIQPLTTVHVDWYVDYSHGVRLVKRKMIVDNDVWDLWDVLKDPELCFLVSDEGPIPVPHY